MGCEKWKEYEKKKIYTHPYYYVRGFDGTEFKMKHCFFCGSELDAYGCTKIEN